MAHDPLISIVTVSYNQAEFIRKNIESVLKQNYPFVEHVIIDGGSTDGTLEILRSYPHLQWVSEPDRGQSHGLNKGFRMARGEYLGWMNSDDWLEPNVLADVVEALRSSPVVMGMCEKTDRHGHRMEVNPNVPRSFYDILKYWVMYSTPDQPGVFFRKHVLDEVALAPGVYLDEELDFCMDVDLWLRISRRYEFKARVPKITSHYRWYDESKSGSGMAAAYRETSRVFFRHATHVGHRERALSYVIPITAITDDLKRALHSVALQEMQDGEVVLVDYVEDNASARANKKSVIALGDALPPLCLRYARCHKPHATIFDALNRGYEAACSPLVVYLAENSVLDPKFGTEVLRAFHIDLYGVVLPYHGDKALKAMFTQLVQNVPLFNVGSLFDAPLLPPIFAVRKVAMMEVGGFRSSAAPYLAMRELLLRLAARSWNINIDNTLEMRFSSSFAARDAEVFAIISNYTNAKLVTDLTDELAADPFAETRWKQGMKLNLDEEAKQFARGLLREAPEHWETIEFAATFESLSETARLYPKFAPAWFLLARHAKTRGDTKLADEHYQRFLTARKIEER